MKKPTILLVNDDGIHAEGLTYLYLAMKDLAEIIVAAPASQQSGKGLSVTIGHPIKVEAIEWNSIIAHKVHGTPADCVKIAFTILKKQPDFIFSGINQGCNSGRNVLYSGTVGGVIEGVLRGIPGIAFSLREFHNPQYEICIPYIRQIFSHFLEYPIPQGSLINVNFPKGKKEDILGVRYATQGLGYWIEDHKHTLEDEHHFGAKWNSHEELGNSDVALLKAGYVAVSPLHVSSLTDMNHYLTHQNAFDEKFSQEFMKKN